MIGRCWEPRLKVRVEACRRIGVRRAEVPFNIHLGLVVKKAIASEVDLLQLWIGSFEIKFKADECPLGQIAARIPPQELAKLPADGSKNVDRYVYGTPKEEA